MKAGLKRRLREKTLATGSSGQSYAVPRNLDGDEAATEIERLTAELAAERERAEAHFLAAQEADNELAIIRAERDTMRRCLGFFASVIKSGEPWTETCQQEYDAARKGNQT